MPKIIITDGEKLYRKIMLALVMTEPTLEPTIKPGDTVIISLTQRQFAQGGIFVVNLDGTQLLCRLSKLPGRFRIAFDNPQIKDFESEAVDIRGRVLWISQAVYISTTSFNQPADCLDFPLGA